MASISMRKVEKISLTYEKAHSNKIWELFLIHIIVQLYQCKKCKKKNKCKVEKLQTSSENKQKK